MSMMSQLGQWTRYWHSGLATASRQSAWSSSGAAEELLGPRKTQRWLSPAATPATAPAPLLLAQSPAPAPTSRPDCSQVKVPAPRLLKSVAPVHQKLSL